MAEWKQLMGGKLFITDLGAEQHADAPGGGFTVGRYAVWAPIRKSDRHQIVEVGGDLTVLMAKYRIPEERVCLLGVRGV